MEEDTGHPFQASTPTGTHVRIHQNIPEHTSTPHLHPLTHTTHRKAVRNYFTDPISGP